MADIGADPVTRTLDVGFSAALCIMLTAGKYDLPTVSFVHFNENGI